jgi:hypothetical protein
MKHNIYSFHKSLVCLCLIAAFFTAQSQNEAINPSRQTAWWTSGNNGTNPVSNFIGTIDARDFVIRTTNTERARVLSGGNFGIGEVNPLDRLHVSNGNIRVGEVVNTVGGAGYGRKLIFSGGNSFGSFNSDNSDELAMVRYNVSDDVTQLRMIIGDNNVYGTSQTDALVIGNNEAGVWYPKVTFRSDGKTTMSRDGIGECCGNDATLALAELTTGAGGTGRRASISFHNGNEIEGTFRATSTAVFGVGYTSGRFQLMNGAGNAINFDLTGGTIFFGNSNSRTETRSNAGLRGDAGALSGFFEYNQTSGNSQDYNYPSGYSGNTWWHLIDSRHSTPGNNFALQFSGNFFDQKLFVRKTNNNAATAWNRVVNTSDANATNGYLMFDVSSRNGAVEGSITAQIVNGTLTLTGFNEGGVNQGIWYSLTNVANAKIMLLITNDDTGNCGGTPKISSTRIFTVTNNGAASNQATDLGCSGSDGNNMSFFIAFNPL